MAGKNIVVNSVIEGRTEEVDGRWRAVQERLGLFVYGDTADEASQRMTDALNFMTELLVEEGGIEALLAHLKNAGIQFEVKEKTPEKPRTLPLFLTLSKSLDPV